MKFPELSALYHQPLFDLISQSRAVHLQHWRGKEIQRCSLLSIKTGGCSEDCAYCAQSAHYSTGLEREELLSVETVLAAASRARSHGATRFCMGAGWRGGIIGMGESEADRLRMLEVLSNFDPAPDSVPINCLMPMPGTPLVEQPPVDIFELVRLVALTRIALPKARVRLAAGRTRISREGQALCFFAGANSIFFGDKLLTAKNPEVDVDLALLYELGLNIETGDRAKSFELTPQTAASLRTVAGK